MTGTVINKHKGEGALWKSTSKSIEVNRGWKSTGWSNYFMQYAVKLDKNCLSYELLNGSGPCGKQS